MAVFPGNRLEGYPTRPGVNPSLCERGACLREGWTLGLYTILPLPILYGVWHTTGGSVGSRISRNGRAIVLQ